ncbi:MULTISPECIES: hypothetical protein [Eubacteriales]|uniref:hypothetical protein n=1 Tax=Eubacteriales TaxID=186802 RepID=UPI0021D1CFEB|nr:hypothetical protein [Muriventricola aceti]MCU6704144.1 hypothetical protein [Muriventricola aceti]
MEQKNQTVCLRYKKAAEQDDNPAACVLAKDASDAARWLKRSTEAGNQLAQYRLGRLRFRVRMSPERTQNQSAG